jgi:hypothetical protein
VTKNIQLLAIMLNETSNVKCNKIFGLQNKVIKLGTTTVYLLLMPLYRKFIQFYFQINLYIRRIKKVVVANLTTHYRSYEVMNNMVVVLFFLPNNRYSTDFFHFIYCTHE